MVFRAVKTFLALITLMGSSCGSPSQTACDRLTAASAAAQRDGVSCSQTLTAVCPTTSPLPEGCIAAMDAYADCVTRRPPCRSTANWFDQLTACSRFFRTGVCELPAGAKCAQNSDCRSQACESGICSCSTSLGGCASMTDCCAGLSCSSGNNLCQ